MKRMLLACVVAVPLVATVHTAPVTYYRDVLPILQKHCLSCHRPGQIGPMSFISYQKTRPWADAIRHVIVSAKMPAWSGATGAEPGNRLSLPDVDTLLMWVDEGAPEGDPTDAPPPVFPEENALLRYSAFRAPVEVR
jgi:hypothetical protein